MIEKFEDLELTPQDTPEEAVSKVESKLEIKIDSLKENLNSYLKKNAEELAIQLPNIAPHGDYVKLLEDNDSMTQFLRDNASNDEHWKLKAIAAADFDLIQFLFANKAIDDGESVMGYVYVSKSGKVRHSFVSYED